jgi:parallel beta-helix repeat protein
MSAVGKDSRNVTVRLDPGASIQAAVDSSPPGTRFLLRAGIYRRQSVVPKSGDTFVGPATSRAILDGAVAVTSFSQSGRVWMADVAPQPTKLAPGQCMAQHPLCKQAADLYFDGEALTPVMSRAAVSERNWYFDVQNRRIYLGSNPAGHVVEIGQTEQAFTGPADNVTIDRLTVEHYANGAQNPAISVLAPNVGRSGHYWTVQNCEVLWNHGTGIGGGHYSRILHNHVHHNGQLGITAGGNSAIVQGNEIDHNNTAGYDPGWEAGGTKFVRSVNLIVNSNNVHDNRGPGLWTDGYNMKTLYENNHTLRNWVAGILHEISYDAIIRNNDVENDGYNISGHTSPWYGGGIVISGSSNVEVYGNTVTNCTNGIILLQPDHSLLLMNVYIHENIINQATGVAAGSLSSSTDPRGLVEYNNRFRNNIYDVGSSTGDFFECFNRPCPLSKWKELGND